MFKAFYRGTRVDHNGRKMTKSHTLYAYVYMHFTLHTSLKWILYAFHDPRSRLHIYIQYILYGFDGIDGRQRIYNNNNMQLVLNQIFFLKKTSDSLLILYVFVDSVITLIFFGCFFFFERERERVRNSIELK